jgi:hypothetical protein
LGWFLARAAASGSGFSGWPAPLATAQLAPPNPEPGWASALPGTILSIPYWPELGSSSIMVVSRTSGVVLATLTKKYAVSEVDNGPGGDGLSSFRADRVRRGGQRSMV